jgi:hypothetical protein
MYSHEPGIALFYLLGLLLPFAAAMFFLIRQNRLRKAVYTSLYRRVWALAPKLGVAPQMPDEGALPTLITEDALRQLEQDVAGLEASAGLQKAKVLANAYSTKPHKMKVMGQRLAKLEQHLRETAQ